MTAHLPARPPPGLALVDDFAARGRATFTTEEAIAALAGSQKAVQGVLRRLRTRGEIATPVRGFHVIVQPEYRTLGCRPAIQFVDALAGWIGSPYYVGLLSAAEIHGAAHQRPQITQVVVPSPRRSVRCGKVAIDFVQRGNTAAVPVVVKNTPTGTVRVATPEATALDLLGYVDHCGGIGNVTTVLRELAEDLAVDRLVPLLTSFPAAWGQRLGWLLELAGATDLAAAVGDAVSFGQPAWTPLDPRAPRKGVREGRWRVIVNASVERDE